jgi:hypothetical protein
MLDRFWNLSTDRCEMPDCAHCSVRGRLVGDTLMCDYCISRMNEAARSRLKSRRRRWLKRVLRSFSIVRRF